MNWKKVAFTDLDGTLLNDEKQVSEQDYATLKALAKNNVARVAATGRPLQHVFTVIPEDYPLDYVIFSSGAGIIRWEDKAILYKQSLLQNEIKNVYALLMRHDLSFAIQHPIPDNHYFYYQINGTVTADFQNRCKRYASYARPLPGNGKKITRASQFLVTFNTMQAFNKIAAQIPRLQIIRATSPADFQTIWMEIFPQNVSKGQTANWLIDHLKVEKRHTFAIGNDYNDLHMLQWAAASYVVDNAPEELKQQFTSTLSNRDSGFSRAIYDYMKKSGTGI